MKNSKKVSYCNCKKERDHKIIKYISKLDLEFRDVTGKNNNQDHPEWGESGQQLLRKCPSDYADGLNEPAGQDRPSTRIISNELCAQEETTENSKKVTAHWWLWGQWVDHDLDLTVEAHPVEHFNIPVPVNDEYFDPEKEGGKYRLHVK